MNAPVASNSTSTQCHTPGSANRIRLPPAHTRSMDTQDARSRTLVPAGVRAPLNAVSGARYSTVRSGESDTTRIGRAVITAPFQSFRQSTGSPGPSMRLTCLVCRRAVRRSLDMDTWRTPRHHSRRPGTALYRGGHGIVVAPRHDRAGQAAAHAVLSGFRRHIRGYPDDHAHDPRRTRPVPEPGDCQ